MTNKLKTDHLGIYFNILEVMNTYSIGCCDTFMWCQATLPASPRLQYVSAPIDLPNSPNPLM